MARKPTTSGSSSKKVAPAAVSTPVRNSPLPKAVAKPAAPAVKAKEVTFADIARRAYEIWASGKGGSEVENWLRAEHELKGL